MADQQQLAMALMYPQGLADQAAIEQQRSMAQALLAQGMQSMNPSAAQINGVAYRQSPFEGMAKMLQTWAGIKGQNQSNQQSAQLAQNYASALRNRFGAGQSPAQPQQQATPDPSSPAQQAAYSANFLTGGNAGMGPGQNNDARTQALANALTGGNSPQQAATQPSQAGGDMTIPGMNPESAVWAYTQSPDKYMETLLSQYKAPDIVTKLRAAGIDPMSARGQQLLMGDINSGMIKELRPGGAVFNPATGAITTTPSAAQPGFQNVQLADGTWATIPVRGGLDAIQQEKYAETAGEGSALPYSGVDASGNPLPVTNRTQAATGATAPLRANNPGALMPGGRLAQFASPEAGIAALDANLQKYGKGGVNTLASVINKWAPPGQNNTQAYIADVSKRLGISPNQRIDLSNPLVRHALATGIMLHENGPGAVFGGGGGGSQKQIYGAPPMGAASGAQNAQNEMSQTWQKALSDNANAQTSISLLNNIKRWAPQAITGPGAAKLQYMNGLLSIVGVGHANDMATASSLVDKNSNQIIAKLGQNGLGTDAARMIVQAGTPNAHMPLNAITEAADSLISQHQMAQARARYLMPAANARQPAQFAQRAQAFDQYADPRIWQLASMAPAHRAAFMSQQPDADRLYQSLQVARQNRWIN